MRDAPAKFERPSPAPSSHDKTGTALSPSRSERRAAWRRNVAGWLWVLPWVVGCSAFLVVPIGMSFYYSFTDYPLLDKPVWVGLENYRGLLGDSDFWLTLWNTFVYVALAIPLCTITSLVLAALLNRSKYRNFFQAAIFLPTLVPLAASAIIFMWLFNGQYGLINQALGVLGIEGPAWLLDRNWAMPAVVLISLWGVGQAVVLYVAALQEVPEQLYEAADIDGMNPLQKFITITLPMISPVILFNVVTMTIGAFQVFVIPYVLFERVKGGPDKVAYFYTHYLYDNAFIFGKMGYASAMAFVQLVLVLAFTAVFFWASKKLVYYRG
jgi:multiple sugar transport system permease protein